MREHGHVYPELPLHPVPESIRGRAAGPSLTIGGLVARPLALAAAELDGLPAVDLSIPFECEEGWSVPSVAWAGPRLEDVVGLAQPLPDAAWVRVICRDYAVPVALADCGKAVLACYLNGQPLDIGHGGPWRLVLPGGSCFTSVKWVERLEVSAEPGEESGRSMARARLKPAP